METHVVFTSSIVEAGKRSQAIMPSSTFCFKVSLPIPPTLSLAKANDVATPSLQVSKKVNCTMACDGLSWHHSHPLANQDSEKFLPLLATMEEGGHQVCCSNSKERNDCLEEQRMLGSQQTTTMHCSKLFSYALSMHPQQGPSPKNNTPS